MDELSIVEESEIRGKNVFACDDALKCHSVFGIGVFSQLSIGSPRTLLIATPLPLLIRTKQVRLRA
jgi:hypothetical protein